MKRQLIFGTVLSAALAVGVGAQQPPASGGATGASPQTPGASDRPAQSMTVTGCLASSDAGAGAGAAAAAPATPGAQARGGFILKDVTPAGSMAKGSTAPGTAAPGSATGTTGTAGTAAGGSTASTYRLTGGDNLQQYVGQKVEVTGSVAAASGSSSPSSTPGSPAAGAGASAGSQPGPGFPRLFGPSDRRAL